MKYFLSVSRDHFVEKLKLKTKEANPFLAGSPFGVFYRSTRKKPFIGDIKEDVFRLTRHNDIIPYSWFLRGTIREIGDKTELELELKPFAFSLIFELIVIILFLFAFLILTLNNPSLIYIVIPLAILILSTVLFLERYARKSLVNYFLELNKNEIFFSKS